MSGPLPSTAECVVVGGGVVGCSLAYHLACQGMKPLLLERGEVGGGSTARNAGGVRQQFSTEVNIRVGMLSRQMLERFPEEIGHGADLRQIGYLLLATDQAQANRFQENVDMQRRVGLRDVQMLTPAEALGILPDLRGDDLIAATFCPSDGLAGPNEVCTGYAAAARRLGAEIREGVRVEAIERSGGAVSGVRTDAGTVGTPAVINCAGPHAGVVGDMAGVTVPVRPYRRHLFLTEPFSLSVAPPMTVDFSTSFYFHPEGAGLLLGMSDPDEPSSFDLSVSWEFLQHLVEHATWRVPALAGAEIAHGWAGLYEVSPDHQAIVGESPELSGFWLCCGFSGHGFMQAPAVGALLADVICGGVPAIDIDDFNPRRFLGPGLRPETSVI